MLGAHLTQGNGFTKVDDGINAIDTDNLSNQLKLFPVRKNNIGIDIFPRREWIMVTYLEFNTKLGQVMNIINAGFVSYRRVIVNGEFHPE